MPTYAFETESNSDSNGVVDTIDYSEISPEMMEMFEEQNVDVNADTSVYVIEATDGYNTANALAVENVQNGTRVRNILLSYDSAEGNAKSVGECTLTNTVERNNARSVYPWSHTEKSITVTASATFYDYDGPNTDIYSYIRPISCNFYYTNAGSYTVKSLELAYQLYGYVYTYPGLVYDGYAGGYNIARAASNPVEHQVYSKSDPLNSFCISPERGNYVQRAQSLVLHGKVSKSGTTYKIYGRADFTGW